ncbi:hypothetical protein WDJ51_09145 [Rathayibacter sp. YIM 133350]|uniref:hypothetical protein n=1 Tax=Rathayibacter sp. YIM 133350 TaxID=3131992 RepID=UPI00307D6047
MNVQIVLLVGGIWLAVAVVLGLIIGAVISTSMRRDAAARRATRVPVPQQFEHH